MGRRSSIKSKPEPVRTLIERLLREDRYTVQEIRAQVADAFGEDAPPSRSALGRYKIEFDLMSGRMREMDQLARVLVSELGESPDDKAGALLTQAVTTLATSVALQAHGNDDITVKEVAQLARAARNAIEARRMSRRERIEVERQAIARATQTVGEVGRAAGISPETLAEIERKLNLL